MQYEYKAVPIGRADDLQSLLDQYSREGWRLVNTYESMGYTVRLIFEREALEPQFGGLLSG